MLSPEKVQQLVTIAFTLEAISDKKNCTTRYTDLPGKPLEDFLISGINVGKYFYKLTENVKKYNNTDIFSYFVESLKNSTKYKAEKIVNFGLLEILFPTVYARLICEKQEDIIDTIINLMKRNNKNDVKNLLEARKTAWKTSTNLEKKEFDTTKFSTAISPIELYNLFINEYPTTNSSYQWALQYKQNLPILKYFLDGFEECKNSSDLLIKIPQLHNELLSSFPETKIGIIADMCAAAIFLHLSFL